jgi:plasmid replication initiation protein
MLANKREVIKHSSAIQISNNITLLQRRAWNLLLANAYNELLEKDEHQVELQEFLSVLKLDTRNDKYLKQSLKSLSNCNVEWNLLDKDGQEEWGVTSLLSEVVIKNGIIYYSYGNRFRKKLFNPSMYAKINLNMQNRFNSKHSLALYELAIDYFRVDKKAGETPYISMSKFRQLMGFEQNEYKEYKELNRRVLQKSIDEINKKSDLFISLETKRRARKVTDLKFWIIQNPKKENLDILNKKTLEIFNVNKPLEQASKELSLFKDLQSKFLLSPSQADEILTKYQDQKLLKSILKDIELKYKTGEVKNLGAYSYKVLREHNGKIKKSTFDLDKEEEEKKRREQARKELIQKHKDEHRKKYDRLVKDKAKTEYELMFGDELNTFNKDFEEYLREANPSILNEFITHRIEPIKGNSKDVLIAIELAKFMVTNNYIKVMKYDDYFNNKILPQLKL